MNILSVFVLDPLGDQIVEMVQARLELQAPVDVRRHAHTPNWKCNNFVSLTASSLNKYVLSGNSYSIKY